MTFNRFYELWCSQDDPTEQVLESDLAAIEQKLKILFPQDYRSAILEFGLPNPKIALLSAIVDQNLNQPDISNFYSPPTILDQTLGWREIGMPKQLIAFAGDCCGNMFCFDEPQLIDHRPAQSEVWFFDHDFGTVDKIAASFDELIATYCKIMPSS